MVGIAYRELVTNKSLTVLLHDCSLSPDRFSATRIPSLTVMAALSSNQHNHIKVLEHRRVSPPPGSVPPTSLPLTFFDIPWLLFSPDKPLFFYELPCSTSHFISAILPNIEHSLTIALQHYFPFAGNLITPPKTAHPELVYFDGDSISLVVAESSADFRNLCGHHPRNAQEFHFLVPHLQQIDNHTLPVLAIQITVFPGAGICIGLAYRLVVADERTFDNFLKFWSSVFRFGLDLGLLSKLVPCYDRNFIKEPDGVKDTFLKQWTQLKSVQNGFTGGSTDTAAAAAKDVVRATFVVDKADIEKIKQWILLKQKQKKFNSTEPLLLSPYVLACAYLWVCLMKARGFTADQNVDDAADEEDQHLFGFIAGGIHRLDYQVPTNYFGNCVAFGRSMVDRSELLGEDGILVAAKAIGDKIKELNKGVLEGVEQWISDWKELLFGNNSHQHHVRVSGSPKVDLYGLDFGWGTPEKIEDVSIEITSAISLCGSRDKQGGIEIGLSLPTTKMEDFCRIFTQGLKSVSVS